MRMYGIQSLLIALLALTTSGATPASSPSTAPTTQQTLAQRREGARKEFNDKNGDLPMLPGRRASNDLFALAIDKDGMLLVRPKLGKTDRSRVDVIGLPGPAVISIMGDQANTPEGTSCIQFEHNDFTRGDEVFRHTQLFTTAASMQLSV